MSPVGEEGDVDCSGAATGGAGGGVEWLGSDTGGLEVWCGGW